MKKHCYISFFSSVHFQLIGNHFYGHIVLDRAIEGFLITTAIPTIFANAIGHATNFFREELFDAAIGVNLTILLVLTTMSVFLFCFEVCSISHFKAIAEIGNG